MTRLTLEEPLGVDGVTFKGGTTLGEHFAHTIDALQRRPAEA